MQQFSQYDWKGSGVVSGIKAGQLQNVGSSRKPVVCESSRVAALWGMCLPMALGNHVICA